MQRFRCSVLFVILISSCAVLSFGCSVRLADLTMISTRNVTLEKVDVDSLPQEQHVEGSTTKWVVLGFPIGFPHLEDAIDDALDEGKGDLMIDTVVYSKGWSIILIGQNQIKVKGNVVKTRGLAKDSM